MRYTDDTENLMKQLRKRNDKNSEFESDILYHALIKKMPGIIILPILYNKGNLVPRAHFFHRAIEKQRAAWV